MGRRMSDVSLAIHRAIARPATSREVAARLQLSMRDATVHLSRMAARPDPLAEIVERRREPGVARPVPVYRAIDQSEIEPCTVFDALNQLLMARRSAAGTVLAQAGD
jgi:predicted ArsR family transcriptional regulator